MHTVLVIGGGVAGVASAARLTQKGHKVILIEASPRLGGRIHTLHEKRDDLPIELGPEFVHGEAALTKKYASRVKKMKQKFNYFEDGKLESLDHFPKILEKGFKKIDEAGPDAPMSEIISQMGEGRDGKAFATFIEGFFAGDPGKISQKSLAGSGGNDFAKNSQIQTGYISLVQKLKSKIDHLRYEEHLNQPIESIKWSEGNVKVRSVHGETWEAESAVITVPIEKFKTLRFDPPLGEKFKAAEYIGGGSVIKPVVRFKEPLWDLGREDHQQIVTPNFNFTTRWVWKDAPQFQLTSWVGGAHAEALQEEPFDVLLDLVIQDVSALTGRDPEDLKHLVDGFYYHNWFKDHYIQGAYSFVKVGGEKARATLAKSVDQTLYFAGEATATDGSDGTVEGALKSGFRAAKEIEKV